MVSVQLGEAFVDIRASLKQLDGDMKKARGKISGSLRDIGKRAGEVGRSMTTKLTLPIAGIGAAIIKTAADFDTSMRRVEALTGATGDELENLRAQAKQLGSTTEFSASQAAEAMGFLAQAGFRTDEIMSALPATLNLATAGQVDLGRAADISSDILTAFGKDASELSQVVDVLAKTSISANTNVEQLGEAMKFVAPTAASAGINIEEVSAAMGVLGSAGLKGSIAGTSLNRALLNMLGPTKKQKDAFDALGVELQDSEGNLRSLTDIVKQVEASIKSGGVTADETALIFEAFGTRGGRAIQTLVEEGGDSLVQLKTQLENAGGTGQEVADTMRSGVTGAMNSLRASLENLAISIAEAGVLEAFTDIVRGVTDVIDTISKAPDQIKRAGAVIAGVLGVGGPVLIAIGAFSKALGVLIAATGPIGLFIAAATAIIAAWEIWGDDIKAIVRDAVAFITEKFNAVRETLLSIWTSLGEDTKNALRLVSAPWRFTMAAIRSIVTGNFEPLRAFFADTLGAIEGLFRSAQESILAAWRSTMDGIREALRPLRDAADFVERQTDAVTGAFEDTWRAVVGESFVPDMVRGIGEWFGQLDRRMTDPAVEATGRVTDSFDSMQRSVGRNMTNMVRDIGDTVREGGSLLESFRDSAFGILDSVARALERRFVQEPISKGIDFGVGFLGDALGSLFSPVPGPSLGSPGAPGFIGPAADGARIRAGQTALVGEEGPELFTADSAGTIVPNSAGSGTGRGLGGDVNIEIFAPPGSDVRQERQRVGDGENVKIFIDQVGAEAIERPGSRMDRALRQRFGLRPETTSR